MNLIKLLSKLKFIGLTVLIIIGFTIVIFIDIFFIDMIAVYLRIPGYCKISSYF